MVFSGVGAGDPCYLAVVFDGEFDPGYGPSCSAHPWDGEVFPEGPVDEGGEVRCRGGFLPTFGPGGFGLVSLGTFGS